MRFSLHHKPKIFGWRLSPETPQCSRHQRLFSEFRRLVTGHTHIDPKRASHVRYRRTDHVFHVAAPKNPPCSISLSYIVCHILRRFTIEVERRSADENTINSQSNFPSALDVQFPRSSTTAFLIKNITSLCS